MSLRSFLFVPGDSEKKLGKGATSGADALTLDLEDSVAPERKAVARGPRPSARGSSTTCRSRSAASWSMCGSGW